MTLDASLHHILYLSRLAPGADFSVVKDIVQTARSKNPPRGITGALLFDGERFCQLLEGPQSELVALMQVIAADTRHADVRMLHEGKSNGPRELATWRSGYCEAEDDLDAFDSSGTLTGAQAVAAFVALARQADLE